MPKQGMITSGQKEQGVNVIVAAARKAGVEAIEELSVGGVLNVGNFQRGVLAQGDKIGAVVKTAVKNILIELAMNIVGRLKLLFADKTIWLMAADGKETLAEARDVFQAGIYGAEKRITACKATPKTLLNVYELIKNGTYSQIFGGFGENLKRLCWEESQIVAFCRDHHDLLRKDGCGTFFLYEGENGGFFVANVNVRGGGRLDVIVCFFEDNSERFSMYQHRIVVPQL